MSRIRNSPLSLQPLGLPQRRLCNPAELDLVIQRIQQHLGATLRLPSGAEVSGGQHRQHAHPAG